MVEASFLSPIPRGCYRILALYFAAILERIERKEKQVSEWNVEDSVKELTAVQEEREKLQRQVAAQHVSLIL